MVNRLDVFQSLWAMELRQEGTPEPSDETNMRRIANAGFQGISLDAGTPEDDGYAALNVYCGLCNHFDLDVQINAFPESDEDMHAALQQGQRFDGRCRAINVIGRLPYFDLQHVAATVRRWIDLGDQYGIPVFLETHRYAFTNDLIVTLQIMDQIPNLKMTADLSHALVNQEWVFLPLTQAQKDLITQVLVRSESFQGRVASPEQIQVQLDFPQHQIWVEMFKQWWLEGFRSWQSRHSQSDSDRCVFLCELGPPPYAITGSDGTELSDRWNESLLLKQWATELWEQAATQAP